MFKNILVATDGTERSKKAVRAAVQLAHDEQARITGFFPLNLAAARPHINTRWMLSMHEDLEETLTKQMGRQAEEALCFIEEVSRAAGVPCASHLALTHCRAYQSIIEEAESEACDLIFMAADHREGIAGWLAGSEATKVMTHSKVPVLLYRD